MPAMRRLFELMAEKKASDIFVSAGAPIAMKINGQTMPINKQIVKPDTVRGLLTEILNEKQMREFDEELELNTAYPVEGVGSFRISAFVQRGSPAIVVRYIPHEIPQFESLGLPPILKDVVLEKRGLVLLVGATGSGKSTSIAAMIDHRNSQMSGHMITIEDPIEYLFRHKKSIINQRELGTDSKSYHVALKNALRQAPDLILISEIRDREAMSMAIAYAQSGHLCLSTLHANNSYHALNRIISFYSPEMRAALLQDLSASLRCICSQRLVRSETGSRIPAVEVLLNTRHVAELIETGHVNQIKEAIEKSLAPGSMTFEQSLFRLVKEGKISRDEALRNADSASNLLWHLNNSESKSLKSREAPPAEPVARTPVESNETSFSRFIIDGPQTTSEPVS